LDAIGEPLTERTVHRSEVAARLLCVDSGATITPELLADLIGHESGGLKGVPHRAEVVVLLTHGDARLRDGDVQPIAEHLLSGDRIGRVIWAALRAPDPVVALWPCASAIR
jgi:probable selenium-dependent hydroxylase accessory protein YqeC